MAIETPVPKVGDRVVFRLYAGPEVDGMVRAILKTPSGTKLRLEHRSGPYFTNIGLDEIIWSERE